jgi:ABC-type dipeptide/oligopeptide/nickel transport system permease component
MPATLRRIALVPVAVLAAHFFGFAFAHIAVPLQAARNPLYAGGEELGPLLPAYGEYLARAALLDFGTFPGREAPLGQVVAEAARNSLGLAAVALVLSVTLGVALGLGAARSNPPVVAPWLTVLTSVGLAMPGVFLGSLLITALFIALLWGYGPPPPLPLQGFGWDSHMVLPVIVLMVRPTVQIAQVTAGLVVDELSKPYVTAARSRGVPWRRIVHRHVFRNVAAPVTQTISGSLRLLVAELIVVERLFAWPGLGALIASTFIPAQVSTASEAVLFLNPPVVGAALALLALLFVTIDGLAATVAQNADPRLRAS